jgi:hypothetical protein
MSNNPTQLDERDEIEMLLPWYVTGRLGAADTARVESWLARDANLARQLELIEDERRGSVLANESVVLPASLSIRRSIEGITHDRQGGTALFGNLAQQVRRFFEAPQSHAVRWAAAMAVAVIVLEGAWIGSLIATREPTGYVTASGGTAQGPSGTFALVRFADAANARDIVAALAALNMSIADGPKAGGLFRVRIGDAGMTDESRDARIAELKRNAGLIALATPTR